MFSEEKNVDVVRKKRRKQRDVEAFEVAKKKKKTFSGPVGSADMSLRCTDTEDGSIWPKGEFYIIVAGAAWH